MDITADELINMFDMSIVQIGSKEGICRFLDILARNPELDFMDAVNIFTQYPSGKMLNTYRGWDKDYGRHIKRWEKGIKAIEYIEEELRDDDGEVYDVRAVPRLINKYDISQTQGKAVEQFAMERNIQNKKCQNEFRTLLSGIVVEQQKELGIPLNSLSGICSKHVLLKYYGISDMELDKHLVRYSFNQTESVSYFLGELFELLDKVCDKLKFCYAKVIAALIATAPAPDLEDDKIPVLNTDSVRQTEEKPVNITSVRADCTAETSEHKSTGQVKEKIIIPVAVSSKDSLLKRLRIKVKEAKIYNSKRNI